MNFCQCKDKKTVTSSASGKSFKVCSKNLGGCGKEIDNINRYFDLSSVKITIDGKEITTKAYVDSIATGISYDNTNDKFEYQPIPENLCPACEGSGEWVDSRGIYRGGCPTCDGKGYVI